REYEKTIWQLFGSFPPLFFTILEYALKIELMFKDTRNIILFFFSTLAHCIGGQNLFIAHTFRVSRITGMINLEGNNFFPWLNRLLENLLMFFNVAENNMLFFL
ncbi:hypothetical protein ACJX0J_006283, partial [Zea mays]